MILKKVKDKEALSIAVSGLIIDEIQKHREPCINLNSGGTHLRMYEILAEKINGGIDVSRCTFLSLDEYIGPAEAVYTVKSFMNSHFYKKLSHKPLSVQLIDGDPKTMGSIDAEIKRYQDILKGHRCHLQLLGLGTNGHIGANEPGTAKDSVFFCAAHEESTIASTMGLYGISREQAPTHMFTLGIRDIMAADTVLLAAAGLSKAEAVKSLVEGSISSSCPASYLKEHPNFIFVIDEDAASLLS